MATENPDGESYYGKVDGIARWFGMSVSAAFFASLERFSCVNLSTSDSDDEDDDQDDANDRPFTTSSFQSFNTVTSLNQNVDANLKNTPSAVEHLPV